LKREASGGSVIDAVVNGRGIIQGYLAHKKKRHPLGPYSRTKPRALWWF